MVICISAHHNNSAISCWVKAEIPSGVCAFTAAFQLQQIY